MKLFIALLLLILPASTFGDSYTGIVSEIKHFHDGGIAIDLDGKYPREKMILYVPSEDVSAIGAMPPENTNVTAHGVIVPYKGTPEIKMHQAKQWTWEGKSP